MNQNELYNALGVSADKEEVHEAIKNLDKGIYPNAFCKVLPDIWQHDEKYAVIMHADTAGTKPSISYLYFKETGNMQVWEDIAQDALVMNLDDMACVGCFENIAISSTIARNKHLIPGSVISSIIQGASSFVERMKECGVELFLAGGETADVGDVVRTIDVGYTTACRMKRTEVFENNIQAGDIIVGLASYGQASYEKRYNSGIGSNGLTAAKHQVLSSYYRSKFPDSANPLLTSDIAFSGSYRLTDSYQGHTVGDLILSPTRTYIPVLADIFRSHIRDIHGVIHNSGGALTKVAKFVEGLRIVKDNLLEIPPVFQMIRDLHTMSLREMYKVYNMGQRLEVYLSPEHAQEIINISKKYNIDAQIIGRVEVAKETSVVVEAQGERFEY